MSIDYDVIVIGGGSAGLAFARGLADTNLQIAVIDKQTKKNLESPSYDGRETALTHLSYDILNALGIWSLMPEDHISLIKKARVLNGNSLYSLDFDCKDTNRDNLGFMISNHYIRKAAYESLKTYKNVDILTTKDVKHVSSSNLSGQVTLKNGKNLTCRLIVAADSRSSETRRMMGISTDILDFGRVCIVGKVIYDGPQNDTAVSYTHLRAHETVLELVCRLLLDKRNEPSYLPSTPYSTGRLLQTIPILV